MITRYFNLFVNAGSASPLVISANQYDHGEQWVFTLYSQLGVKYEPSSGAIVGVKSDNLAVNYSGTVDSEGRVVINETIQMTAVAGRAIFELLIDGETHGTANFYVEVEPKPGDNADFSASDLSLIQEAINSIAIAGSGAPAVVTLASGMTDEGKVYLYAGSETGYTNGHWYYYNGSAWVDGGLYGGTVDATLTMSGVAADAKKTGDEINDLKSEISSKSGLTADIKLALMNLANAVAFKGDDPTGQTYIDALEDALYPPVTVSSITAVYGGGVVYDNASLNSLKSNLVVTARYTNGTSEVLADSMYVLSGTIAVGTQTITVTYANKTATFTVVVEHNDYLYVMPSEFESTGANRLDSEVALSASQTATFMVDLTLSSLSASLNYVMGNKQSGNSNNYISLQCQKNNGSTPYMWGMGISWANGQNLVAENHRYRFAAIVTINSDYTSATANANVKDITTGGTVKTYSNTYTLGSTTAGSYALGKELNAATDNGFIGTVHDFRIYDGEMPSADITDYLTNGAS